MKNHRVLVGFMKELERVTIIIDGEAFTTVCAGCEHGRHCLNREDGDIAAESFDLDKCLTSRSNLRSFIAMSAERGVVDPPMIDHTELNNEVLIVIASAPTGE